MFIHFTTTTPVKFAKIESSWIYPSTLSQNFLGCNLTAPSLYKHGVNKVHSKLSEGTLSFLGHGDSPSRFYKYTCNCLKTQYTFYADTPVNNSVYLLLGMFLESHHYLYLYCFLFMSIENRIEHGTTSEKSTVYLKHTNDKIKKKKKTISTYASFYPSTYLHTHAHRSYLRLRTRKRK